MNKKLLIKIICLLVFTSLIHMKTNVFADERKPLSLISANKLDSSTKIEDYGGLSLNIVKKQKFGSVIIPTINQAAELVIIAAYNKAKLLVEEINHPGKSIVVPDEYLSIQEAINAAEPGDSVLVRPGTYFEQLNIRPGIKLISYAPELDNKITIKDAVLKLPERVVKTVIDGSKNSPSKHGMLDFAQGCNRDTVVDGFTIQNLPDQNHHIPGHAHAVNLRGTSPILMNCIIKNNGSTGIGSHVIYNDQEKELAERDFRYANIKYHASALIYNNIVKNNLGRGIGCNHFASPTIIGNEVMDNDDSSLGEPPGPGIGIKHGASPFVMGNIIHDNHGGGILIKYGAHQGKDHIDKRPSPILEMNLIYNNGVRRPALSCQESGTKIKPIRFAGNYIYNFGNIGIGIGNSSYGIIENNIITNGNFAGIAVRSSTAIRIADNTIAGMRNSAFAFVGNSTVEELNRNTIYKINNTPFIIQESTVEGKQH